MQSHAITYCIQSTNHHIGRPHAATNDHICYHASTSLIDNTYMTPTLTLQIPVDVKDIHGNTLLTIACQNGNKRVAKAVLRRGANINTRNLKGNTPLHYCYHYGYAETLGQYLISKGADVEARNNYGRLSWEGI